MYNLSAQDLQFKWEAFSMSGASRTLVLFTSESAAALKSHLQRGLAMQKAKTETKAKPGRSMPKFGNARNIKPKMGGISRVSVAGPSRVAFVGPSDDSEAKKTRSCELL